MNGTKARLGTAAVLVAVALAVALASPVGAQGLTRSQLEAHGWACLPFPFPPATPIRHSCFNPGEGRPMLNGQPSYTFLAFAFPSGDYIGTGHLIRGDLYAGEPCAPGSDPYVYRAAIDYYECIHA